MNKKDKRAKKSDKIMILKRRIVKRVAVLVALFVLIIVHTLLFGVVLGKPLTFSYASDVINFSQSITPFNPVVNVEPIKETSTSSGTAKDLSYRVINQVPDKTNPVDTTKKNIAGPVTTFSGAALYPNSEVILEIHSTPIFTTVLSDSNKKWSWTNYGEPLEAGEHTIEIYNIAPYQISGKKDIFAQKYSFTVDPAVAPNEISVVTLTDSAYQEKMGDGDLGDKLLGEKDIDTYILNAVLLDNKEYHSGDTLDLQLVFSPLRESDNSIQAKIDYSVYQKDGNKVTDLDEDDVAIKGETSFLKLIHLKGEVLSGEYILKVSAKIGDDTYVQVVPFSLNSEPIIRVGSLTISQDKFGKAMVWDIIIIAVISILILLIVGYEFQRLLVYRAVDEKFLKKKGYL